MSVTPAPELVAGGATSSPVVTRVFEEIVAAVHEGRLLPGQRISDAELAAEYGVSRTPVREALQRLREIGVIEASASRFTRIADVRPDQTAQAMIVWTALFGLLLDEVIPACPPEIVAELESDHRDYLRSMETLDLQAMAIAVFSFVNRFVPHSHNPYLQKSILSVVHVVRLGSLHLPRHIDFDTLRDAQVRVLDAARTRDRRAAGDAVALLGQIEVPLE